MTTTGALRATEATCRAAAVGFAHPDAEPDEPGFKLDPFTDRQPMTEAHAYTVREAAAPMASAMLGLSGIDLARGLAREGDSIWICWLRSGHRITVAALIGGGVMVSKSTHPDPDCPPPL